MPRRMQFRSTRVRIAILTLIGAVVALIARGADHQTGEFGGDLNLLRSFVMPARSPAESNWFVDMWEGQTLQSILSMHGLTNNHALFVNCHGKRISSGRFAFYPHQSLLKPNTAPPYYSAADLATVLGPARVRSVHNLVLAACNAEGALSVKEFRKVFPNATNIVHSAAGELGYQPMFVQAIVNSSWNVRCVYEWREKNDRGEFQYVTGHTPVDGAKRFAAYTAELFRPGSDEPFRVQRAGRELLDPDHFRTVASRQ